MQLYLKINKKMGLILTSKPERKISILGTDLEISSVYLRIQFNARLDGTTIDLNATAYANKQKYIDNTPVAVDIVSPKISINLDPLTQNQSIETAHSVLKSFYEDFGYTADIDL